MANRRLSPEAHAQAEQNLSRQQDRMEEKNRLVNFLDKKAFEERRFSSRKRIHPHESFDPALGKEELWEHYEDFIEFMWSPQMNSDAPVLERLQIVPDEDWKPNEPRNEEERIQNIAQLFRQKATEYFKKYGWEKDTKAAWDFFTPGPLGFRKEGLIIPIRCHENIEGNVLVVVHNLFVRGNTPWWQKSDY